MEHQSILLIIAIVSGLIMAFGIGANDVANAMGTSVGSRALTIRQAIVVAAIFESAGAVLAGGEVTATIRNEIIKFPFVAHQPEQLVYGMIAALLAAGIWLFIASYFGWPVSTTHSIIGALVGFGVVSFGYKAIYWSVVGGIVLSWILAPIIAGFLAFLLFRSIQKFILDKPSPISSAKIYGPFYVFLCIIMVSLVTFIKGIDHLNFDLALPLAIGLAVGVSIVITLIAAFFLWSITHHKKEQDLDFHYASVERIFSVLMIITACAMAFAHGSNDVANAIGPLSAVFFLIHYPTMLHTQTIVPFWILLLGAAGLVIGLATWGYRVIATIGRRIISLTPSHGFAIELATMITIFIATGLGIPVSTSQTLVGGILGVGIARGIDSINLSVVRNIFLSWLITLPSGAILAIVIYRLLKLLNPLFA